MGALTTNSRPMPQHQANLLREIRARGRVPVFTPQMMGRCRALEERGFLSLERFSPPREDPRYATCVLAYAVALSPLQQQQHKKEEPMQPPERPDRPDPFIRFVMSPPEEEVCVLYGRKDTDMSEDELRASLRWAAKFWTNSRSLTPTGDFL